MGKKGILVCLRCGSTRLKRKTHILGIIPGSAYICKDCGFESPVMFEFFPESPPLREEVSEGTDPSKTD
ncbi:MAG: hypothetical protein HXS53_08665 [Theionarchaea archaeon]|nr:hypothetical protein [Theionarchaea archaeon]